MSTALPAKDKRFAFHPASLCLTLSKRKFKSWLLALLCLMEKPRYFPRFGVDLNQNISHRDSLESISTFGEKYT